MFMMWKMSESDWVKTLNTNFECDRPLDDDMALGNR